jgi:hypothetical protein
MARIELLAKVWPRFFDHGKLNTFGVSPRLPMPLLGGSMVCDKEWQGSLRACPQIGRTDSTLYLFVAWDQNFVETK